MSCLNCCGDKEIELEKNTELDYRARGDFRQARPAEKEPRLPEWRGPMHYEIENIYNPTMPSRPTAGGKKLSDQPENSQKGNQSEMRSSQGVNFEQDFDRSSIFVAHDHRARGI